MTTPLYLLSGPTASGKTGYAHALADRLGLRLLSVDSMMVYRGMDIGTAKPSPTELARYEYAGLNLADPPQPFSVGKWLRAVAGQLDGRPALAVGGTGLYFRALIHGLEDEDVPEPEDLPRDTPALQARLRAADPHALNALADPGNPRRLARAIAWIEAGRGLPSSWDRNPAFAIPVLQRSPEDLSTRIISRARAMFDHGLLDETRALLERGPLTGTAAQAIGYAEAAAHLRGDLPLEDAIANVAARTRRYAKRQRTWFRNQMDARWIEVAPDTDEETVLRSIQAVWERTGPFEFGSGVWESGTGEC